MAKRPRNSTIYEQQAIYHHTQSKTEKLIIYIVPIEYNLFGDNAPIYVKTEGSRKITYSIKKYNRMIKAIGLRGYGVTYADTDKVKKLKTLKEFKQYESAKANEKDKLDNRDRYTDEHAFKVIRSIKNAKIKDFIVISLTYPIVARNLYDNNYDAAKKYVKEHMNEAKESVKAELIKRYGDKFNAYKCADILLRKNTLNLEFYFSLKSDSDKN